MVGFSRRVIQSSGRTSVFVPHLEKLIMKIRTGDWIQKKMSLQAKIKKAQDELAQNQARDKEGKFKKEKKTVVQKHGLFTVTSLVFLGMIIGSIWTFNYIEGKKFFQEMGMTRTITISNEMQSGQKVALLGSLAKASTDAGENQEVQANNEKPTEEDSSSSYKGIRKAIYQLESSSGTKGTDQQCHSKGLHNGYGYIPFSCYESDEATGKLVDKWIQDKQKKGLTTPQLLCLYNTGKSTDDCQYYQDYLAITK